MNILSLPRVLLLWTIIGPPLLNLSLLGSWLPRSWKVNFLVFISFPESEEKMGLCGDIYECCNHIFSWWWLWIWGCLWSLGLPEQLWYAHRISKAGSRLWTLAWTSDLSGDPQSKQKLHLVFAQNHLRFDWPEGVWVAGQPCVQ